MDVSPFGLLDAHGSLRLVIDLVHEDDALCLALTCRGLRDAVWVCFQSNSGSNGWAEAAVAPVVVGMQHCCTAAPHPISICCDDCWLSALRTRTRTAVVVVSVPRLVWARSLHNRPAWLPKGYGRDAMFRVPLTLPECLSLRCCE